MFKVKIILAVLLATLLISESAFARAGGRSIGSGGGRSSSSYSNFGSRGNANNQGQKYAPSATNPANQGSFFQNHPFLSGLGGGLVGSWLGHMFFGGMGGMGMGGGFGLMPIILIGLIIWGAIRYFRGANIANITNFTNGPNNQSSNINVTHFTLPDSEKQKFSELLTEIQLAWGMADMERLKKSVTPEVLKYFADSLHQNQSQGLENKVENIQVLSVIINEAWQEEDLQYATALLRWSAIDYMINTGKKPDEPFYIAEGDKNNPAEIAEAWTFVRFGLEGKWILSAIDQVS